MGLLAAALSTACSSAEYADMRMRQNCRCARQSSARTHTCARTHASAQLQVPLKVAQMRRHTHTRRSPSETRQTHENIM